MTLTLLVGLVLTIVYVDPSYRDPYAVTFAAVFGFCIVLSVTSFRYHCVTKESIRSESGSES